MFGFPYSVPPPQTPTQTAAFIEAVAELATYGIDPNLAMASIRVGVAPEQEQAWARLERKAAENSLHGQAAEMRRINDWTRQARQIASTNGIGFYGVKVVHGVIKQEATFSTMRRPTGPRYDSSYQSDADRIYLAPVPLSVAARIFPGTFTKLGYTPDQFWRHVLADPKIGIYLEEGVKKALARLSAGGVAIALGGIDGGFQAGSGGRLQSILRKFAKGGRQIIVQFDRPGEKRPEVRAGKRMVRALNASGADARLALWEGDQKGTDDVLKMLTELRRLATEDLELLPNELRTRIEAYLQAAPDSATALAMLTVAELVPDGDAPRRLTREPWLISSTEFNVVHVLDGLGLSNMSAAAWDGNHTLAIAGATGTAKTESVLAARDALIDANPEDPILTICPTYRASLAGKYGSQFGVPLIRGNKVLRAGSTKPGASFCLESGLRPGGLEDLHRKLKDGARALLLLDEADQVLVSLLIGGTEPLVENRRKTLDLLLALLAHENVLTVALDAGLSDMTLDFLEHATGRPVRLLSTSFTRQKSVRLVTHKTAIGKALRAAADGIPVRVAVATPKLAAEVVEALSEHIPKDKILTITGENSGEPNALVFMQDPDGQAPRWRALVHTQALVSGVSLTGGHFKVIVCLQDHAMGPADVIQLLNRDRLATQRFLAIRRSVPQACPQHRISSPKGVDRYYRDLAMQADPGRFVEDLRTMPYWLHSLISRFEAQQVSEALNSEVVLRRMLSEEGYDIAEVDDETEMAREPNPKSGPTTTEEPTGPGAIPEIWQLVTGEALLEEHHERVDHELEGSLPTDRILADLTEKLALARGLRLDRLATLGTSYTANTPEVMETWEALCTTDKPMRQRLTRAGYFQKVKLIPGCDQRGVVPPVNMRTIGAVLAKVGGKQAQTGYEGGRGNQLRAFRVAPNLHIGS
ncbi:DUF3854 domain-containing protein [Synechococcus sp. CS-1328]|uniref:DUF3854 domain-containing protein n=1 Tax=Synechococcus sp. CS-1328 TaxID=2847976 RepID=UPI00223B4D5D|nr:DUF3854 domain-containing protein [Synechococcus sp. CS-1328]